MSPSNNKFRSGKPRNGTSLNIREHLNRAHKALGMVSKIQDFCDDPTNKFIDEQGDSREFEYADFLPAIRNPLRPESVKILEPFAEHCKEWPSRATWQYVEEFLTTYEVTKISKD